MQTRSNSLAMKSPYADWGGSHPFIPALSSLTLMVNTITHTVFMQAFGGLSSWDTLFSKMKCYSESTWKLYYSDLFRLGFLPEVHDCFLHHKFPGFQIFKVWCLQEDCGSLTLVRKLFEVSGRRQLGSSLFPLRLAQLLTARVRRPPKVWLNKQFIWGASPQS